MLPDDVARRFERISEFLRQRGRDASTASRLGKDPVLWGVVEEWPISGGHLVVDARLSELDQLLNTVTGELPDGDDRRWVQELSAALALARPSVEQPSWEDLPSVGDDETHPAERWEDEDVCPRSPPPDIEIVGKWPPE